VATLLFSGTGFIECVGNSTVTTVDASSIVISTAS
jgi:hypothetical protein